MTHRTRYTDLIREIANHRRLPFDLLEAMVIQESGGDTNALRYEQHFYERYIVGNPTAKAAQYGPFAACSCGLMQILVEVAYEIGYTGRPEGLFVPRVGLLYGATKFRALVDRYGSDDAGLQRALGAYNGGHGAVASGPPYKTHAYIDQVWARAGRI